MAGRGVGWTRTGSGMVLSRRRFLRLGGASLAGAALLGSGAMAGCGGGGGGGAEGDDIVFSMGPDTTGNLQKLVRRFNEQSDGFQVRYREMPADTGQYFDKLRTQFQAGSADIDVIGADVIWPAQLAANGWLLDLSDRFSEADRGEFLEGPVQSLVYEDKIYGVPWFTDAGMLYYRQDLLEEAGFSEPPATWDELKEMAAKTARDTNTENGMVFQGANYEGGVCNGLEYVWTHGGDAVNPDDPTQITIDSPEAAAGLATQRSLVEEGVAPQAVANYTETESHAAFLNGDAVFIRNWPYMYALAANPDESRIEQSAVGVSAMPVAEGQETSSALGGWNMLINAASEKQEQAWEFVRFMTSEDSQRRRALEASLLPTRSALYEDQEVVDTVPVIRLGAEALQNSRPRPVSPVYSDMSLKMAEQFNNVTKGNAEPEQAVATLQGELEQIVEQAG